MSDTWNCGLCGAATPKTADACLTCPPHFHPWRCPGCKAKVHSSYLRCPACDERRPKGWIAQETKASKQQRRAQMRDCGLGYVQVLGSPNAGETCPAALVLAAKDIPIDACPLLPLPECNRKRRCKCVVVAAEEPPPLLPPAPLAAVVPSGSLLPWLVLATIIVSTLLVFFSRL